MANSIEKLFETVSKSIENGDTTTIKVRFKKFKRNRFVKKAVKDIAVFYGDGNYAETIDKLNATMAQVSSDALTVSAVETAANLYGRGQQYSANATRAISKLPVFEIYKNVLCQTDLYEAFPDRVFLDEDVFQRYTTIREKTYTVMGKVRQAAVDKGVSSKFNEKLSEVDKEVLKYKTLIETLK